MVATMDLEVTSGKAWREAREIGFAIRFPSGNVARIRPMEVDFFILNGRMPDDLAEEVVKLINGNSVKLELPAVQVVDTVRDQWVPFLNQLCKYAFISPKVVDTPQADDEISVDDIAYTDKVVLYRMFGFPAQVLRKFREKQTGDVAVVESQSDNVPAPQPVAGNKRVGITADGDAGHVDGASI